MTAHLSPILSNDSAANSIDEATPIVVRTYEAPDSKHIDPEEQRHLMIARAGIGRNLSDSSNSSSDLASELGDVEQSPLTQNVAHNQASRQSSASSSLASSTLAGSYLFIGHTARNNNNQPMTTRTKICEYMHQFFIKLKQAILSIPLVVPLTISIISVVSIYLVMFSDKRFMFGPENKVPSGVAQPLTMEPSVDPLATSFAAAIAAGATASEVVGPPERGDSSDGDGAHHHQHQDELRLLNRLGLEEFPQAVTSHPHGSSTHNNHRQLLQKLHQQPPKAKELSTPAVERLFNFQQLQLKSQLIGDLLRNNHSPQSKRQSMSSNGFAEQQQVERQQQQRQQQQQQQQQLEQQQQRAANPTLESLRAMLINNNRPNGATTNEETPAVAVDLAGSIDTAGNTGRELETGAIDSRPALLRSSALELDLDEQGPTRHNQNQNGQQQHHQQQHQQQHSQYIQPATVLNYRRPTPSPTSPVHQQQSNHILQAYKANEEHARQYPHINNHDRPFDVAQIQCNITEEGFDRFACPTPDPYGRFRCIEDRLFCDGYYDCPGGEDEEGIACMYYRLFVSHIDVLTNTFLSWMKKQNRFQSLTQWETPGD